MSAPFPNLYTHRKVAESSAKACDICYKPSTSVLITADNKDFFYVCPAHLKDKYFCTPKMDENAVQADAVKAKREKALAEEMERLKKEYEEQQRRKKVKESKDKQKDKDKDKGKDEKKDDEKKDQGEDQGKDDKEDAKGQGKAQKHATEAETSAATKDEEPRIFELKSTFFQQRLQKKRQAEAAKRDRERASQPNYFPSVPTNLPGK
ncbi:hypothetical protein XA68_13569 [Ophiocordyceps unilateralis]|uniref:VPS4-associated protein 1 n=1 Tax=Ophiocordyceps unilateralis TaxID=268505 RepID=A0A2A9PCG8_OPHUN|nr:hypothetical protein XA68_13569 [Ophiocordyceps unilateralis]